MRNLSLTGISSGSMAIILVGFLALQVSCSNRKTSYNSGYRAVSSFDERGSSSSGIKLAAMNRQQGSAPSVQQLWDRCHYLSKKGLRYSFGSDDPYTGGMDCSGSVQFVLKAMGYNDVPRASYQQYKWMQNMGAIKTVGRWSSEEKAYAKMRPGDLIFWGGTYNSGHKVSHVEIYMGRNPTTGQQYTFGARSSRSKGLNGNGVDVFKMSKRKGRMVGYGTLPGLRR